MSDILRKSFFACRALVPRALERHLVSLVQELRYRRTLPLWRKYLSDQRLYREVCAADSMDIFKKYVSIVHLEISSYCNRCCGYCINSTFDGGRRAKHPMMEALFDKAVRELAQIDYSNYVEFNGFNEPFADRELFLSRLIHVKRLLPHCTVWVNSNGDFLDQELLDAGCSAGMDVLMTTLQLNPGEFSLSEKERSSRIEAFCEKLRNVQFRWDDSLQLHTARYSGTKIFLHVSDFYAEGHNMGGTVKTKRPRKKACFMPCKHVYVDYSGRVALCCIANMDSPHFRDFQVGDIRENTIFDIYGSAGAAAIRRSLISLCDIPPCCRECEPFPQYFYTEGMVNPYHPLSPEDN